MRISRLVPLPVLFLAFLLGFSAARAEAAELKFSTWNLDWLTLRPEGDPALPEGVHPRPPEALGRLAHYAELLKADVIALEEVDGPEPAARIFPPGKYALHFTRDPVVQRVGFAIRRGIPFHANRDLTELAERRSLRSGADITLDLPDGPIRVLAVHLKTGCRQDRLRGGPAAPAQPGEADACTTLRHQMDPLVKWIAAREAEGIGYVVMGDFNRWMDHDDAFFAALYDTAPLVRVTEGLSSPCWGGGGFIDHVILGGPAIPLLVDNSLRVLVYREKEARWKDMLSDHCPVSIRLSVRLPVRLNTAEQGE